MLFVSTEAVKQEKDLKDLQECYSSCRYRHLCWPDFEIQRMPFYTL